LVSSVPSCHFVFVVVLDDDDGGGGGTPRGVLPCEVH